MIPNKESEVLHAWKFNPEKGSKNEHKFLDIFFTLILTSHEMVSYFY